MDNTISFLKFNLLEKLSTNVIANEVKQSLTKYKIAKIIPALLWSGIIFFLCFLPGSVIPKEDWLDKIYIDKIAHISLYFIFFILIVRIFKNKTFPVLLFAGVICLTQGILIEFIQESSYVQNRSFDKFDIAANITGVVMANMLYLKNHKEN